MSEMRSINRLKFWGWANAYSCENCIRNSTFNEVDCLKIPENDPSIVYWENGKLNGICPNYQSYSGETYPAPKNDDNPL